VRRATAVQIRIPDRLLDTLDRTVKAGGYGTTRTSIIIAALERKLTKPRKKKGAANDTSDPPVKDSITPVAPERG
jgi:metal-responsive CopG/Arc/MetJ family transcriptional regulator